MPTEGWWKKCLTQLATQHDGVAGLIYHDFSKHAGDILAASEGVPSVLLATYPRISKNHPWAPYMWRDPIGTLIFGEEREVHARIADDYNSEAFLHALLHHNLARGMGAILWKDRPVAPRWVIAVGILKHSSLSDSQVFSSSDQEQFLMLIPALTEVAKRHAFVLNVLESKTFTD